jgi:quinol---cytochrome c reductase cytochrome c subunit, bacillus type
VAEDRIAERQRVFKQYKEDVKTRGKPFYPYAMLHDTIMSLVVVAVIIGLAVVWKWTVPGHHHTGTASGWLGPLYDKPADPGTFSFVPRPDWYFYFLFYLLRIFKWPASVILATVGIPTILLLILIAMPFIDVRAERHPLRRPVAVVTSILVVLSMGILTYKGATAKEALPAEILSSVPKWAKDEGFAHNKQALAGARIFASSGCANCHVYDGSGQTNVGAPTLTAIGASNQGAEFFAQYVADPAKYGNNVMPHFGKQYGGQLSDAQLSQLGAFLDASKGKK